MISLMDLPREMRDRIFELTLELEDQPPSDPSQYSRVQPRNAAQPGSGSTQLIAYPIRPPPVACIPLLLVNHCTHDEILDLVRRLQAHGRMHYKLNCRLESEAIIYPTWIKIPALSTNIHRVQVDFQITGTRTRLGPFVCKRVGGPDPFVFHLLSILKSFFACGPDFRTPLNPPREISIGVLFLNVMSPTSVGKGLIPQALPSGSRSGVRNLCNWTGHVISPEELLSVIADGVSRLLVGCDGLEETSQLVEERIRRIEIALDDRVLYSWDLEPA